jgi:xanthine/CO dehydrogenase XdhC/CoxF family maturation factor
VKEHFPHAGELVHVPRADFSALADRSQQYVVVMTHHLELDREAVRHLLPLECVVYLGVLGSRSRIRQIVEYAAGAGSLRPDWLDKLHAPVGLDIGAATPQEIALSIMAEIVARRNGRPGGPLRNRRDLAGGVLCAADGGRA